ncbi:hypothetical protein LEN26_019278 [Aphanomyces euteiches]|nr:hypothetical protein LEN26_019278 [Aphanomyces euteiches]
MNNNDVEIMERRFSSHGGSKEYTMDELCTQLDDMDKELRQAATYGLLLVAKNEELVIAMERMQVAQEGALAELKGEIQTLERHRETLQSDRDGWKLKCHEFEDEIFQLQQLPTQSCTCSKEPRITPQVVADLDLLRRELEDKDFQLHNALKREKDKDEYIRRLQQTKRDTLDVIHQMKTSSAIEAKVRKSLEARNAVLAEKMAAAQTKLDLFQQAFLERELEENRLRTEIEELHEALRAQTHDVDTNANLIQTWMYKCNRLEKELESLQMAMPTRSSISSYEDIAATASFDRLESFFNLTALGIILEHQAQDQFKDGSSRQTIEAWFREALMAEMPYHTWHNWLTKRITATKPPIKGQPDRVSPTSALTKAITLFFDKYKHKVDPTAPTALLA